MAHLDEILTANQRYCDSHQNEPPSGLSMHARRELCIITCMDPRLVRFFPTALGVERGDAVLVRLPGASVLTANGDGLRAVAATIYINKATEFLVMGHTDCGTTKIDQSAILSEMQKRGVPTQSMPGGPREFLGGIGDMRQAVKASAAAIRSAPFIPRDILVHAAILDIETGALEIVERGENFQTADGSGGGGGSLGYKPGPSGALSGALGDGSSHLSSTGVSALFSGNAALAPSQDLFAAISNQLPPGWSSGDSALASQSGDAIGAIQPPPATSLASPVELASPMHLGNVARRPEDDLPREFRAAPPTTPAPAPKPPAKKTLRKVEASPAPARRQLEADANILKVREFYRHNFNQDQRRQIQRALANAARQDMAGTEQVRIVVKPILDLGQKRYKVIDEVIAIKEKASGMIPHDAFALLSQLFD